MARTSPLREGSLPRFSSGNLATVLLTTGLFTLPNALLRPAVISLTSKQAGAGQGAALGLNNSFNSLGRVVGPIWAGFAFDWNYNLPYLSGAAIMFAGFAIGLAWVKQGQEAPTHGDLRPKSTRVPREDVHLQSRAWTAPADPPAD